MNNVFTVKINNINFADFTKIFVRKSMETLSGIAYFKTANIYLQAQRNLDVFMQDPFEAFINKTPMIKGEVELIDIAYGQDKNYVEIGGRDKTSILVDSDWTNSTNEWKKQTISNLMNIICSTYDIQLSIDVSAIDLVARKIESFKINEGETAFQAIKRLCSENRILPISYGDNKLTLTSVSSNNFMKENLKTGNFRILEGRAKLSNVNRFSSYVVKGTGKETVNKDLISYLQLYGIASDSVITNPDRVKIHLSETELDFGSAKEQAAYIRNLHAGYSRIYIYTVKDWVQSNGELWEINSLVPVDDKFLRLKKQLLIYQIDFKYNKQSGFISELYLIDKNTFTNKNVSIISEFDSR